MGRKEPKMYVQSLCFGSFRYQAIPIEKRRRNSKDGRMRSIVTNEIGERRDILPSIRLVFM